MKILSNESYNSFIETGKYYAKGVLEASKYGLIKAFPPVSFAISSISAFMHLAPEFLFEDPDIEDPNETFIVRNEGDEENFISFYLKHEVRIDEKYSDKAKKNLETQMRKIAKEVLFQDKKVVDDLNTSAKIGYTIYSEGDTVHFAKAYGGVKSYTNPLIERQLPCVEIPFNKDLNNGARLSVPSMNEAVRQFVLTHEFMHILNNDTLSATAWFSVTSIVSSIPWIVDYNASSSLGSHLISSLSKSFLTETISHFFYQMFARNFERRADVEAMNYLKTNEGAIEFISGHSIKDDSLHPPQKERLKYIENWEAA